MHYHYNYVKNQMHYHLLNYHNYKVQFTSKVSDATHRSYCCASAFFKIKEYMLNNFLIF